MLTKKARLLLSLIAATPLVFAACTDNNIVNPTTNAAGTYQLTVFAGKGIPAPFTFPPGDADYPNGATFLVTDGTLVLNTNGTFLERNNFVITPTGEQAQPDSFDSSGTFTLNGTFLTLFDQSGQRTVNATLITAVGEDIINYTEANGDGTVDSYEYRR